LIERIGVAPRKRSWAAPAFATRLLERDGLAIAAVAFWVAALSARPLQMVVQDSWLSFVDGRLIARHGLPHVDTLTSWTLGRHWIDQQWLAHLVLYEVVQRGGVRAAVVLGLVCVVAALAVTAVCARSAGAGPRWVAPALLLGVLAAPWLAQLRAQSFALVLFAAVYALVVHDARRPGRRVFWALPLLVLWANLHGSVALGAGLTALYGLLLCRRRDSRARGLLLALASPLCLLASPYGLQLVGYYRLMLLHPPFAKYIQEWQPASFSATNAIFFVSAFVVVALWGAHRRALTPFERWALPLVLTGALLAVRNAVWFELAAVVALPRLLDAALPARGDLPPRALRLNARIGIVATVVFVLVGGLELGRFQPVATPAAAAAIARAAGDKGIVLPDDAYADWLLWQQPSLAGRVAYDVRFELFDPNELTQLVGLDRGSDAAWRHCGAVARVVMFPTSDAAHAAFRDHLLAPGSRTMLRLPGLVAVTQPVRAHAGACTL